MEQLHAVHFSAAYSADATARHSPHTVIPAQAGTQTSFNAKTVNGHAQFCQTLPE